MSFIYPRDFFIQKNKFKVKHAALLLYTFAIAIAIVIAISGLAISGIFKNRKIVDLG
jgi:hypothetical protein